MGIPFILDDKGMAELRRIKANAEANPVSRETLKAMMEGMVDPVGDHEEYSCVLPVGFKIVYSIEEQPCGKCRHLSVRVQGGRNNRVPNEHMVGMVMKELGFKREVRECLKVWLDEEPVKCVNVLDLYD